MKSTLLRNFYVYNTVLLIIGTVLYSRFPFLTEPDLRGTRGDAAVLAVR